MKERDSVLAQLKINDKTRSKDDFEGEFVDEESFDNAAKDYVEPEYNAEFRYCNKPPQEIDRLLALETDPVEIEALKVARRFWDMQKTSRPVSESSGGLLDEVADNLLTEP